MSNINALFKTPEDLNERKILNGAGKREPYLNIYRHFPFPPLVLPNIQQQGKEN